MKMNKRVLPLVMSAAIVSLTMAGCSNAAEVNDGAVAVDPSQAKIGLLLPDSVTVRYENADRPEFEARIAELCPDCEVLYANADNDAAKQQQQAESMLSEGVSVLVLAAADASAAASIVGLAAAQNVPVIGYDRLINSPDAVAYLSFDNEEIGRIQAQALLDELAANGVEPGDGGILMVNGAIDGGAAPFKKGAHEVFDASDYTILAEYDTPGWDPAKAQDWVAGQLTQFGDQVKGIYSMNDGMTGGAIAAMKGAGFPLVPITGQDAEVSALQRILIGDQFMTIYRVIKEEAGKAAELAIDLVNGKELTSDRTATTPDGDEVPAFLLDPVVVTIDNIQSTVVEDGYVDASEICTADFLAACAAAGVE